VLFFLVGEATLPRACSARGEGFELVLSLGLNLIC